jgi:hypothetical protein
MPIYSKFAKPFSIVVYLIITNLKIRKKKSVALFLLGIFAFFQHTKNLAVFKKKIMFFYYCKEN